MPYPNGTPPAVIEFYSEGPCICGHSRKNHRDIESLFAGECLIEECNCELHKLNHSDPRSPINRKSRTPLERLIYRHSPDKKKPEYNRPGKLEK